MKAQANNTDQRRRAQGFTLFELILVMAILALAAALVIPVLGRFTRGRQNADAALQMLALIQYAQDRAVATGAPMRLQLDTRSGTYYLTAQKQVGTYARLAEDSGRTFTLPATLTASWDGTPDQANRGYLEFDPDGGHDVAVIRLTGSQGGVTLLGCASPGEPYRIASNNQGTN